MQVFDQPPINQWNVLMQRPDTNQDDKYKIVKKILHQVKSKGDKALAKYTRELDGVTLKNIRVTKEEILGAAGKLSTALRISIEQAKSNIETFHRAQIEQNQVIETMPGIRCWRKSLPIEKVGLYIPGGTAPLFSTVLMLGIPAQIAGCREIVLCTPPSKDGTIHPAILFAADSCGIKQIYKAGGAQAIAAMTYGTATIPKVFKLFGPGNSFVTLAKQLAQQEGIAIDMPAGPSEVLVIADNSANPEFVAADLLSQAEHGPDSQVILVTDSLLLAGKVKEALVQQTNLLPRKELVEMSLAHSKIIVLPTLDAAMSFSNQYAPEHLILSCVDAERLANEVTAAGSVFLGHYSPESVGDYASGTNHTLPTNGYAAMYSGVSVDSYIKKVTFQKLTREGLKNISETVMQMAAAEGLDAHKNAVAIRLK